MTLEGSYEASSDRTVIPPNCIQTQLQFVRNFKIQLGSSSRHLRALIRYKEQLTKPKLKEPQKSEKKQDSLLANI